MYILEICGINVTGTKLINFFVIAGFDQATYHVVMIIKISTCFLYLMHFLVTNLKILHI